MQDCGLRRDRFGRFRSDGGGQYVNDELKDFYAKEGIEAQLHRSISPPPACSCGVEEQDAAIDAGL